jgi:hypothetical protein
MSGLGIVSGGSPCYTNPVTNEGTATTYIYIYIYIYKYTYIYKRKNPLYTFLTWRWRRQVPSKNVTSNLFYTLEILVRRQLLIILPETQVNLKVQHCQYRCPTLVTILGQFTSRLNLTTNFLRIYFSSVFQAAIFHKVPVLLTTCPAHCSPLDFNILATVCGPY